MAWLDKLLTEDYIKGMVQRIPADNPMNVCGDYIEFGFNRHRVKRGWCPFYMYIRLSAKDDVVRKNGCYIMRTEVNQEHYNRYNLHYTSVGEVSPYFTATIPFLPYNEDNKDYCDFDFNDTEALERFEPLIRVFYCTLWKATIDIKYMNVLLEYFNDARYGGLRK